MDVVKITDSDTEKLIFSYTSDTPVHLDGTTEMQINEMGMKVTGDISNITYNLKGTDRIVNIWLSNVKYDKIQN